MTVNELLVKESNPCERFVFDPQDIMFLCYPNLSVLLVNSIPPLATVKFCVSDAINEYAELFLRPTANSISVASCRCPIVVLEFWSRDGVSVNEA